MHLVAWVVVKSVSDVYYLTFYAEKNLNHTISNKVVDYNNNNYFNLNILKINN